MIRAAVSHGTAVQPNAKVLRAFIGNWDDASAGREQAAAQINQGADVIFQNADAAGLGVFQAARQTKRALVIGSNSNQNSVAPDITLGSVVIDLPHAFLTVARSIVEELFECEHPWNCPHGRPTIARVPRSRFEEWFHRRV